MGVGREKSRFGGEGWVEEAWQPISVDEDADRLQQKNKKIN